MDAKRALRRWLARFPALESLARLTVETIRICLRYRVTGLASEAGFFALLSLPPLVLGLFGGVGYVGRWLGQDTVMTVREAITEYAARFLTDDVISTTLAPTVDDVFTAGRFDLISVGFVLSLWSGSRALNVLVDTVAIMYGQSGVRGIVPTRVLSFSLYILALVVGIIMIPLVLIGPTLLGEVLPDAWDFLTYLYWPVVSLLVIAAFTSLYHVATPMRSPWTRDLPGALLTLLIWVIASFAVRGSIAASVGGTSIYGPLSAPIVLLIWLYMLAIAVLIGAALNAGIRNLWPSGEQRGLRERLAAFLMPTRATERANERAVQELEVGGLTGAAARAEDAADASEDGDDDTERDDDENDPSDDLDLSGLREAARRPLTPITDDETLVIPRIRVGSGR